MDYTGILLDLTALLATVWALDRFYFRRRRQRHAAEAGTVQRDPWAVAWARSLLPVLLLVGVVRTAVAEPFRIPSASMMPTLEAGDFILVSKFSYGIRLPQVGMKILDLGAPQRGDIVVFRPPWAAGEHWIKRVVGLPGDRIVVNGEKVWINGELVGTQPMGPYRADHRDRQNANLLRNNAVLLEENLGGVGHRMLEMPDINSSLFGAPDVPNARNPEIVPPDCYFVMGDNRDNSEDSRYHGCVPDDALDGKAKVIWMSLASIRRIGTALH
ncbi:MAG TPA: signal peptidase I [Steroidobacteraceae bacterium]|nr:signal peptidase I [Steroidobacteraceae bacterium]